MLSYSYSIENTIHSPTTNISKFLDQLSWPIFDEKYKITTIIDDTSLIEVLVDQHLKRRTLKSSTLFSTIDIRNQYTKLPPDLSLNIFVEFLQTHGLETPTNYTRI